MREIKFRVWSKVGKVFTDTKDIRWGYHYDKTGNASSGESGELLMDFNGGLRIATYPCGNGDNSADSVFSTISNNDDFVIQQFAGLKDKNGKEVYDGDIVEYVCMFHEREKETHTGEVYYENGVFMFDRKNEFCTLDSNFFYKSIKIIGNIFENPELLT